MIHEWRRQELRSHVPPKAVAEGEDTAAIQLATLQQQLSDCIKEYAVAGDSKVNLPELSAFLYEFGNRYFEEVGAGETQHAPNRRPSDAKPTED